MAGTQLEEELGIAMFKALYRYLSSIQFERAVRMASVAGNYRACGIGGSLGLLQLI